MPELLRVIARMNVGGPARHVIRIDAPLRARGWQGLLVTGRATPDEGELIDEARAAGLEVSVLPELGRALNPWRDAAAWRALRAVIAARRPALVHTHTAKAGVVGRLAERRAGGPLLVHSYHGHVLDGYFAPPVAAAFRRVEAALARRSQALIAVSRSVRDELLQRHGIGRPEQWTVIPPGVDRERTRPDRQAGRRLRAELGVPDDALLVGCVGRIAPIKRPALLCEAWGLVAPRLPRAHLAVVGDGPLAAETRGRLALLPRAHALPPRSDLGAVYGALDALLLCSAAEGLPQTVVEALCAGLPVIATAVGGVTELLTHEVDGLLVPRDDAPALAAALLRLAGDEGLRARLREGASRFDAAPHAADAVAGRLAELYDGLQRAALAAAGPGRDTASACTSSS